MYRFDNVFSEEELEHIKTIVHNASQQNVYTQPELGRLNLDNIELPDPYIYKIAKLVNGVCPMVLALTDQPMAVIYSKEYGQPNLPPHFDGDTHDLVVDFQLDSNTDWHLGLDSELYTMKDNRALAFNANKFIHWRPHKEFEDGEYVIMLFFRLHSPIKRNDYSHLNFSQDDPIFNKVKKFRDSLS